MTDTEKSAGAAAAETEGFTAEERAAMQERARELKAARGGSRAGRANGERDVLAKIDEMPEPDRSMAQRIHSLVTTSAPQLAPRTWYGMPAYADGDGKVVCFFTAASKFKERYATLGFQPVAKLDDGSMWPTTFALLELTPEVEERIVALVKQAAS